MEGPSGSTHEQRLRAPGREGRFLMQLGGTPDTFHCTDLWLA